MAKEDKADWEIRLEKYYEKPVAEAKIDGKLSSSTLQSLLIDIERTVGEAKKFLAANMIPEVRTQLDKIRGLLMVFERSPSGSVEQVASLLKAGVSEKVLKEIYGVTDEEIQRTKKLENAKKRTSTKWIIVHDNTVVFETGDYEEAVKRFYELQSEKDWYPPALAIFKQEHTTTSENVLSNPDNEEQEYEITREKARAARAETLI